MKMMTSIILFYLIILLEIHRPASNNYLKEKKYIVFESCLMKLFEKCEVCHESATVVKYIKGSLLKVNQYCSSCHHCGSWTSQPIINDVPVGNILLSAAIVACGLLPQKLLRLFDIMNCSAISPPTFFLHQKKFIFLAIEHIWKEQQSNMLSLLEAYGEPLSLGGDARCDSPGYCAKYGSYTIMDLEHNVILDIELVQVSMFSRNILLLLLVNLRAMKLMVVQTWKRKDLLEELRLLKIMDYMLD